PYEWLTYKQFYIRYHNLASGMINIGVEPGENVGIFMRTRLEWLLADLACICSNVCSVPLYDTLSIEGILYIADETKVSTVFLSQDKIKLILKSADSESITFKNFIVIDEPTKDDRDICESRGIKLYTLEELEKIGSENPKECASTAGLDTPTTICYTSGTTGKPKGAVLMQKNLLSVIEGANVMIESGEFASITSADTYLSFLPLAHIFERAVVYIIISRGCSIGFAQGSAKKVMNDLHELKPSVFIGVPRLFNKIRDRIQLELSKQGRVVNFLFNRGFDAKQHYLSSGYVSHRFWDAVIFSKLKEKLGGRLRIIISGSAPISLETNEFLKICFSANLHEGYGTTETTGPATISPVYDYTPGNVGVPFPNTMVKLVDAPSNGYLVTDKPFPRGEICVKGNGIFKEYYKKLEKTVEVLDEDKWYYTGDIGLFDENGYLKIIDRKKNLFKLSQGEYIAPELIENIYSNHPTVAQAFIYGDSYKSYLVGIIVPEKELLLLALKKSGTGVDTSMPFEELCKEQSVRKFVVDELKIWGKSHKLRGFEHVKNVYIEPKPFAVGALLSPSYKLKRVEAAKFYKPIIDELYEETGNF
ncbi:hypothetical protein BB560_005899, partial [Smittium megazygosporum]